MVSRVREAAWAQSRSCQPVTMTGLEAPSASAAGLPVRVATDLRPERERRRAAHADRQRPDRERQAGRAPAHRGGQREGVEALQLADPQALQAGALDRGGDVEGLGRGPVEPVRQHALDARAHSIEASACWPSRMRPGSSREAALTWKWAVAVWASRKRRCSGASS